MRERSLAIPSASPGAPGTLAEAPPSGLRGWPRIIAHAGRRAALPALASISVTNALYFNWWSRLTDGMSLSRTYYLAAPPSLAFVDSLLLTFFAVAAVLFCGISLMAAFGKSAENLACRLSAYLVLLFFLLRVPWIRISHVRMALVAVALAGTLYAFRRLFAKLSRPLLVSAGALFVIQAASCAWAYVRLPSRAMLRDGSAAAAIPGTQAKAHVLWIVFDEFDYELATNLRPASVKMPEFDRLRNEALSATDAHSPADWTAISFPSYFTGKRLYWVRSEGPSSLYTWEDGGKPALWQSQPTILSEARRKGLNSALVGWHHPYCRIFSGLLTDCFWTPNVDATDFARQIFLFGPRIRPIWPAREVVPITGQYAFISQKHRMEYEASFRHAMEVLGNRKLNLIVLHWLVPHPPGIYNRYQNRITSTGPSNYLDNLALVDVTLGKIRARLEREGLWDKFAVVVTGDHPLRTNVWADRAVWTAEEQALTKRRADPRVPLLIKLPGVNPPLVYTKPVDALLVHDLTLRWMDGQDLTAAAVAAYLDQNRGRFPVHVARRMPKYAMADHLPE